VANEGDLEMKRLVDLAGIAVGVGLLVVLVAAVVIYSN
jgi:hypothetical protein